MFSDILFCLLIVGGRQNKMPEKPTNRFRKENL